MGELTLVAPIAGLTEKGRITAEDVGLLRAEIFANGVVSRAEAESLFAINASCADRCDEWASFFVEAVGDYLIHQEKPEGYVSDDNAAWLVRVISRDGIVDTALEMELLVTVLEKAKSSPASLSVYALEQVTAAVIEGKGPLTDGRRTAPGIVDRAEVDLLRRILHAGGCEGNIAITRDEAEALFRINDGTCEEMNDAAWSELFVKSVASFVLSSTGYEAPSRAEALRRDAFFDNADADIGGFFGRMVSGGVAGIFSAYAEDDGVEAEFAKLNRINESRMRSAATVEAEEARWLADRIMRDRLIHDNERALLAFIRDTASSIHPELQPLLDRVA